jgi:CNT family concentrative nucleoside transporter
MDWTTSLRAFGSLIVMTGLLALMSTNRKKIPWALVLKGMLIQFVFAFLILRVSFVANGFQAVGQVFVNILGYTREGSLFLFGSLISNTDSFGYIFAFQVLPTVIFFSAFTSLMYYWGILQKIVWVFAWIMRWTLKVSGAESLAAAGNIFLGQTEAPLLVKPYIGKMTRSELLSLMTGGMATIAGGVLAAYIGYLGGDSEESRLFFAKHLLAASVMSAPAAIVAAKILVPETEEFNKDMHISRESNGDHWLDALSRGTADGLKLAVNVGAMLLVFTALIYLVNSILADGIGAYTGLNAWTASISDGRYTAFNLQAILGLTLAPLTWLMGVNWADAAPQPRLAPDFAQSGQQPTQPAIGGQQHLHVPALRAQGSRQRAHHIGQPPGLDQGHAFRCHRQHPPLDRHESPLHLGPNTLGWVREGRQPSRGFLPEPKSGQLPRPRVKHILRYQHDPAFAHAEPLGIFHRVLPHDQPFRDHDIAVDHAFRQLRLAVDDHARQGHHIFQTGIGMRPAAGEQQRIAHL